MAGPAPARAQDRTLERATTVTLERDSINPAWSATGGRAARTGLRGDLTPFGLAPAARARAATGQPLGFRLGAFQLDPYVQVLERYNSNLFASEDDPQGDFITRIRPGFSLRSDWNRHAVGLDVAADIGRHVSFSTENYEDIVARASGRLDIYRGTALNAEMAFQRGHFGRGSPDDDNAALNPVTYHRTSGTIVLSRTGGLIEASTDSAVSWTDLLDGRTANGAIINNDTGDSVTLAQGARISYGPADGNEIYLRPRYLMVRYLTRPDSGDERDSQGFDLIVGARKRFGAAFDVEVYLGYAPRYFDNNAYEDVTGLSAVVGGADVVWVPLPETSVTASLAHAAVATTSTTTSSIGTTSFDLAVARRLSEDLGLEARLGYAHSAYQGADRVDNVYDAGLALTYSMNRYFEFGLDYGFTLRDSTANGGSYNAHRIGLSGTLRY